MTTVEWLEEQYIKHSGNLLEMGKAFEQAKELEKQQIVKAVFDSMGTNLDPNMGRAEQYYNEIYKNK
jgi:hypothetical protein